jgi:sterol 14alpha-demethylase
MYQQFGFFRFGLDAKKYVTYALQIQEEVAQYFDAKWGAQGTRCVFTALNELFTLTSARCLLGPEMRALWKDEYAEAYQDLDKSFIPILFFFPNMPHPFSKKCLAARTHFEKVFLR